MKIYLLNAPFRDNFVRCGRWQGVAARGGTMYYPIWLSYATGILENEGYSVRLVDAIAWKWNYENVVEDAKKFDPDLIVVDTNFSSLTNDINITKRLKNDIGSISVIVGPPASQFPERILEGGIDIAARLEFDFTLREIAESIENGRNFSSIDGISYVENGKIVHNRDRPLIGNKELDEIPFVSKVYQRHLNIKDYFLNHSLHPMVQIFTGRGCPNLCTFCSWPETLMGRMYRTRSIENVIDEFEYISRKLFVKEIFIEDDAFTLSKRRIMHFCQDMKKRNISIPWSCQSRATLDYETMKAMKDAGCRLLDVGYESGNNNILKNIKKGTTVEQLREFTDNAKKAKLKILADFVIGFSGETKNTAEETVKFAKEQKPDILQFAVATPIPGTEFYNWCKGKGYLLIEDLEESLDKDGFQKCIISYPELNNLQIESYVDRALKEYYFSSSYISLALKNICGKNGLSELKVIIKSAKVFCSYIRRSKRLNRKILA